MLTSARRGIVYPNPTRGDSADVPRDFGSMVAALETDIVYGQGTLAARPAPGSTGLVQGTLYEATDQTPKQFYWYNGASWDPMTGVSAGSVGSTQLGPLTINLQAASYSLVLADAWEIVEMNVAGANTITISPDATVNFPVGTTITIVQVGVGITTITPGAGVTLHANPGAKLAGQWAMAAIYKRAANEWVASGNLTP